MPRVNPRACLFIWFCLLCSIGTDPVSGRQMQLPASDTVGVAASSRPVVWRLQVDGDATDWPFSGAFPQDSLERVSRRLLSVYQLDGYWHARIDSIDIQTPRRTEVPEITLFLDAGPRLLLRDLRISGMRILDSTVVRRQFKTRTGRPLDPILLDEDLRFLLDRYDAAGHVLAQVEVRDIEVVDEGEGPELVVLLDVDEGERLKLADIEMSGVRRISREYVARVTGLRFGEPLPFYDPDEIRRRLEETGVFEAVELVVLAINEDGDAVVQMRVREGPPGAFDAVVGYLPPRTEDDRGSVVGNANIQLKNLFGAGRQFGFRFNRLPARVTRINFMLADPYVFGLPFSVDARLEGYQRDTTFTKQHFRLETGYRLLDNLEAFVTVSREYTRPGADTLVNVPRSSAWFAGLGFRYRRLDRLVNPTRGGLLSLNVEQGRKSRSLTSVIEDLTPSSGEDLLSQQRLTLESRLYRPLFSRHVLAFGADASVLVSDVYDEGDLFRIGGANTLRGYDEEQYLGNAIGRAFLEWRYILDRTSFLFVFGDLGYVSQPPRDQALVTIVDPKNVLPESRVRRVLPGYGFGIRFGTTAGMFSLSLALNPTEGLDPRIHVGVLLGL